MGLVPYQPKYIPETIINKELYVCGIEESVVVAPDKVVVLIKVIPPAEIEPQELVVPLVVKYCPLVPVPNLAKVPDPVA